jgi:phosphotransferase system enzyme I (PtsI)
MLGKKMEVKLKRRSIVVADNINPADIIKLHHQEILGFCTDVGGKNSHAAIVARSFGVPAVVGTEFVTNMVKKGDHLILDGNEGIIIINPSPEREQTYLKKQKNFVIIEKSLIEDAEKPAKTLDSHKIEVSANIEFLEELEQLTKSGAEGIGLYRTEGIFLGGNELPSEDYQTECYLQFAKAARPHEVVVRTLDVGGDKLLPELVGMPERNPFLGWRAIRFCLDHKEIFIPQLKAILRANKYGNIKILIPMVSSLEEINQFKKVFGEATEILRSEGKEFTGKLPIGMMIEIPSAAIMAEHFAKEVDFFSLGTNDLIQYTLAVDRVNEKISHLYSHFHPALLSLIKRVIDISGKHSIPINMCGEMAGDPVAIPLLIGMGLRSFSANHFAIPEIKSVIRNISTIECQKLYKKIKILPTSSEIQRVCETFYAKSFTIPHNSAAKTH